MPYIHTGGGCGVWDLCYFSGSELDTFVANNSPISVTINPICGGVENIR